MKQAFLTALGDIRLQKTSETPDSPALTMFPTVNYCERKQRTLGLGDIIGLETLY